MRPQILCVDDEPLVLTGLKRSIGRDYEVATATSGVEGLSVLRSGGPFAVVVSDMRMPEMTGAQFLTQVRDEFPDVVRVLLTGQADLEDAISAVNDGQIYRFLSKPCSPDVIRATLQDAVELRRHRLAERELLEGTVRGSIALLVEVLSTVDPAGFDRVLRLRRHVTRLADELGVVERWDLEIAAMMSQIGLALLPDRVLERHRTGGILSAVESKVLATYPSVSADLLAHIPRLEAVAAMISGQLAPSSQTIDTRSEEDRILLGSQLLFTATEFDGRLEKGMTFTDALAEMREVGGFNPQLLAALGRFGTRQPVWTEVAVGPADLAPGMFLCEDLLAADGAVVAPKGSEVTHMLRARLDHHQIEMSTEEVRVRMQAA